MKDYLYYDGQGENKNGRALIMRNEWAPTAYYKDDGKFMNITFCNEDKVTVLWFNCMENKYGGGERVLTI